jgi:hypothetical protein
VSYRCDKTDGYNEIIYGLDEKPFGKTWSEWTIEWWKWLLSIPEPDNPANDDAGNNSDQKQKGTVWYLAGIKESTDNDSTDKPERTCTIPSDKAIFFPILCCHASFAVKRHLKTDAELLSYASCITDGMIKLELKIDAEFLYPLKLEKLYTGFLCKYRISSPIFDMTLPKDNLFHGKPGQTKAASDGYWIFLKPMPQGKNRELTIHFRGIEDDYRTQTTYHIILQ